VEQRHRAGGRDLRTPVVVGVGQASERLDDPGYQRRSPVELAAAAARAALADTGADGAAVAGAIDTVAGIRQFENSAPGARARLGRSDNYPRSVAGRIGAAPARAILEVGGGQGPQHLVSELAATIASGGSSVALVFGAEAISTIGRYAQAEDRPDFTEHADGSLEDRGYGLDGMWSVHQAAHGLTDATSQYALIDNARRARLKQTRAEYAASMGALFAPAHRRPVHPVHRGPGKGQPGRGGAADVAGGGAAARRPGRPAGVPARARRRPRTAPAGPG